MHQINECVTKVHLSLSQTEKPAPEATVKGALPLLTGIRQGCSQFSVGCCTINQDIATEEHLVQLVAKNNGLPLDCSEDLKI